jgi:hypothetical protein
MAKAIRNGFKETLLDTGPDEAFGSEKEGKLRGRLLHRE